MRRYFWMVVVIALAAIIVSIGRRKATPWPERLSAVRLEPSRPILRAEDVTPDNAFYYIAQIALTHTNEVPVWDENEWREFLSCGWADDAFPVLMSLETAFSNELALLDRAAGIPECQVVTIADFETPIPHVPVFRLLRLNASIAEKAAASGAWDEAKDLYRQGLVASDHISRGSQIVGHAINYAVVSVLCQSLRRVSLERDPPADFLREMMQLMDHLDRNAEPFAEAVRYEYLMVRNLIPTLFAQAGPRVDLSEDGPPARRIFRVLKHPIIFLTRSTPARMEQDMAALYSHLVDYADATHEDGRLYDAVIPRIGKAPDLLTKIGEFTDNAIGRMLAQIVVPALDSVRRRWFVYRAELRATQALLAVELWRREHGARPESLEQLVPDYLSSVPTDPFTLDAAPLKYRPEGDHFMIYSVGADGLDGGGRHHWDQEIRSLSDLEGDLCFGSEESAIRCHVWRQRAVETAAVP